MLARCALLLAAAAMAVAAQDSSSSFSSFDTSSSSSSSSSTSSRASRDREAQQRRKQANMRAAPATPKPKPSAPGQTLTISLISLGGDPTGQQDSAPALKAAFWAAAAMSAAGPSGVAAGDVTIDLAGGNYLLKSPVVFKTGQVSGIVLSGGTLMADPASFLAPPFNGSAFMLDFTYSSLLTLRDLVLDGQHAAGCLRVDTVLQSTITNVFFLHYNSFGLLGDAQAGSGHELLVSSCTFAEYDWGEPGYDNSAVQTGVAIGMLGYGAPTYGAFDDSNFYDIIIRCTKVGVVNRGGANMFHGLHVYSTCSKAPGPGNVTVGFLSDGSQTRVSNGYFDDSPLVSTYPAELALTGSLFYGHSALILAPQSNALTWASGWQAVGNLFTNTPYAQPGIYYDATNGSLAPGAWHAMVVADNKFDNASLARATRVSASLVLGPQTNNGTGYPCAVVTPDSFECMFILTGSVDLRAAGLFLMHPNTTTSGSSSGGGETATGTASSPSPSFDWRAAIGPDLLNRLLKPTRWTPAKVDGLPGPGNRQQAVREWGAWRPPGAKPGPGEGARTQADRAAMRPPTAPTPNPVQSAFAGVLSSITGSVITTTATYGEGAQQSQATAGSASWTAAQHYDSSGQAVPGVVDITVKATVIAPSVPTTWAGVVSLQVDQSPQW